MSNSHHKPKRRRVTQACDFCHKRAIKCQKSPTDTSCENYKDFSQPCIFDRRPRKRGLQVRTVARTDDDSRSEENSASRPAREVQEPWESPSIVSQATVVDLVELYFEIVYPIFPLFHRPSLVRRVSRGEYTSDKPLFISTMAICALVAGRVRDGSVTNPRWDLPSLQGLDADVFYLRLSANYHLLATRWISISYAPMLFWPLPLSRMVVLGICTDISVYITCWSIYTDFTTNRIGL